MLKNYFKIALRNLIKSKEYAAINVVGISVAVCICLFLFLISYLQLTFDAFHSDDERIFQTYFVNSDPEGTYKSGGMPMPLAPALKADYPEIEAAARIVSGRKSLIEYRGKYFDKLVMLTDPDFMQVFSFPLVTGNRKTVLQELSSIVLSENTAKAIFGTENPIGKSLKIGSEAHQGFGGGAKVFDGGVDVGLVRGEDLIDA